MLKRILLKISGEQLAGNYEYGVDPEVAGFFAEEIKQVVAAGCQVAVVIGGGNMVRGKELAGNGIRRVTADQMGMLSGLINAMASTDIFEAHGVETRCLSNIFAEQLAGSYSYRLASKHLENNRVVLVAGGIARPYFTHDTAAVSMGLELGVDAVLKATKVDGIYDKDPNKFEGAKLFTELTYQQAIENTDISVMDKAALGLALEQEQPLIVYNATKPGNLLKIVKGESVGTRIG